MEEWKIDLVLKVVEKLIELSDHANTIEIKNAAEKSAEATLRMIAEIVNKE